MGFVIQINDFDRPFFGRFEKQNGRNWPWIKVIKQSLSFFLCSWGKKIKKSYKNLSTNQNASFPILEFCVKKGLKWKLAMHWFQKLALNLKSIKSFSIYRNFKIWNSYCNFLALHRRPTPQRRHPIHRRVRLTHQRHPLTAPRPHPTVRVVPATGIFFLTNFKCQDLWFLRRALFYICFKPDFTLVLAYVSVLFSYKPQLQVVTAKN